MPLYEFHCPSCDKVLEVIMKVEDMPDTYQCPDCGTLANRIVSAFGFQFSQGLKELRSSAYIRGTNIKLEDIPQKGLIRAAKNGDKEAHRLLGGK